MALPTSPDLSRPGSVQAGTVGRPDPSLLPSAYDLLDWLQREETHLQANPGTDESLRRSLVTVLAHIALTYWLDPDDSGMEQRPGARTSYHAERRPAGHV